MNEFDEFAFKASPIVIAFKGRELNFCDQDSKFWGAIKETKFYLLGIYRLTGHDTGLFQVVFQDSDGVDLVAYDNDGSPLKIMQTGARNFPQGFSAIIPLISICERFPGKPFSSEDLIAYLSSLQIKTKIFLVQ